MSLSTPVQICRQSNAVLVPGSGAAETAELAASHAGRHVTILPDAIKHPGGQSAWIRRC